MQTFKYGKTEYKGFTVKIGQDDDNESPRECCNLGSMYCEHDRYTLGDADAGDIRDDQGSFKGFKGIILPLYLYDHGGITISVSGGCGGQVGYIYISDEKIRKEFSVKRISKALRERVTSYLTGEVETYDQYLTGDVYWFSIENLEGEIIESCGGFYGQDYISQEINGLLKEYRKEAAKAKLIERAALHLLRRQQRNGQMIAASFRF